ncbi:gliding motility-associated C-terminal domain-containing protein [Flavobacteriaceae bacterium]|nr:gliding motility-associated C-terminal domain-containing protein [Flavobacteriaceae bacterium]
MKNITTLIVLFCFTLFSYSQCDHTFVMNDSYGDGWSGSTVDILVDGVVVVAGATAADASVTSGSTENLVFQAATGTEITLSNWTTGSWTGEVSWAILDNEGTSLASGSHGEIPTTNGYCTPPPACEHTFVMNDSYGDGWNGSTVDILVDGVVVVAGATAANAGVTSGSTENLLFAATDGSQISISNWTTGSWTAEVSWAILNGDGGELASGIHGEVADVTASCPSCAAPSMLTVDSTSATGAVISWTAEAEITSWEYQLLISGETPAETGTASSDNPLTITGCYSNTSYDLYIRTDCGGTYSSWAMASFTTNPACGDTLYDSGGSDGDYASNELTTVTVFPENDGDLVTFTFLSFNTEANYDDLTVYDGPDTSSTIVGVFDGTEIPDPISSTHATGALTFVFDSDGSVVRSGYEILISCAPQPECLAPTDLTASIVTASSVDVSWTVNNEETQWEYIIQPQGTGTPTTAGTAITTNPFTITGLDSGTDYEIYIRAICNATDVSTWTGPLNITTSPACGDTIYDSGGADGDYSSNELTTVTVYPENDGDLVTFTFLSFNTEGCCDDLIVYDGPDITATVVGEFAGTDIPDPISSTHATGALTFVFDSDGSVVRSGYEILISCAPAPSCFPPNQLNVSNISGTTADFNWTPGTGNDSWEYVILPTGSPAPTAAGTVTTVNSTQFTDLEFLTTYDVYVRADCGADDGYSTWSGPVTFSTTQQTDYTIECGVDVLNINYCYTNNDSTFWVFNSTDGFPLKITFNAGTIEGFWDDLTIYDGSDNTGTVLFNNNDSDLDDFAGLVIESTLTSVYIEVDSDGFGSCESSDTYIPWDFVVACKTCVTQSATYEVVGVCEPNQEFYVDVDLTDLGSAVNISMTDGLSAQTTQSTGMFTFGPYEANSNVNITVTNSDDTSCSINSGDLTFLCPPAPNDCSIIYAGEDTGFCEGASTNLTAVYHPLGQDTTSYDVTTQQGCPSPPLTGGVPTSLEIDDRWSDVIDLGFEFCFFGGTYSQILIGSNGVVSFEIDNADSYNGYNIDTDDTLPNSTNTSLSEANIFGVAHDIDPSVCGSINYMVLGSSPSRQFVVNFSEICHFSCNDIQSSSQIILYESSNTIDINIYDKPICDTWNDGLAVVGVQNIEDTIAFTPPERNTSVWEATDEFWRFTPSLGTDDYVFEWFEGTTLLGNEDTVTVSPTETTTYTASITYNLCNGGTATVTDTVVVEISPTPEPIAASDIVYQCPGDESILEVTVDADVADSTTYYWTYDGVDVQSGPDNTYVVPSGQFGDYLVTAIDEAGCFGDTMITVTESIVPELEEGTSFTKCMNEDVDLEVNVLNMDLLGDELEYTWYVDGVEVQSGSDDYYTHTAEQENGMITVVVTDIMSSCESATIIEVGYYMNANCLDMPQGLSPNGDGLNDCLELDHLEDKEDIVKIEIFNRYGIKVFEMNDYMDQWCGQNASDGNDGSNDLLPVGTYFYVVQFASEKEPIISWIYLNY